MRSVQPALNILGKARALLRPQGIGLTFPYSRMVIAFILILYAWILGRLVGRIQVYEAIKQAEAGHWEATECGGITWKWNPLTSSPLETAPAR